MDSGSMESFDFGQNPFAQDCDVVQNSPNPPENLETPEDTHCVFCKLNGFDGEHRYRLCYAMQSALLFKLSDLDDGARVPRWLRVQR